MIKRTFSHGAIACALGLALLAGCTSQTGPATQPSPSASPKPATSPAPQASASPKPAASPAPRASTSPAPAPSASNAPLAGLTWIGETEDRIGTTGIGADGDTDGHFRATVSFPGSKEVVHMYLAAIDAQGRVIGDPMWHTSDPGYLWLGTFRDDSAVSNGFQPTLGTFAGDVTFDFYVHNDKPFTSGQRYQLLVSLDGGPDLTYTGMVP